MAEQDSIKKLAVDFSTGPETPPESFPPSYPPLPSDPTVEVRHTMNLRVEKLPHYNGLPPLKQATPGSVGIDLYAANDGELLLNSIGATVVVPTGIKIQLPQGLEAQIRPRSGLAAKEGITVLNSPGTVDSDYRGEIKVLLVNLGEDTFEVQRGTRIAQLVILPVVRAELVEVDALEGSSRGSGGFGSTGTG